MVDRVYTIQIPKLRKELEDLHQQLIHLRSNTDWAAIRAAPVLKHAKELERLLNSRKFSHDFSRLTKGVALFHSDLVYLRENVQSLKKILQTEQRPGARGIKRA